MDVEAHRGAGTLNYVSANTGQSLSGILWNLEWMMAEKAKVVAG